MEANAYRDKIIHNYASCRRSHRSRPRPARITSVPSFLPAKIFSAPPNLRQDLSSRYDIPAWFWTDFSVNAPGFFCSQDSYSKEGEVQGYSTYRLHIKDTRPLTGNALDTWFRFLVKQTASSGNGSTVPYEWYMMGFATKWLPSNQSAVLCFGVPLSLQKSLHNALKSNQESRGFPDPYSLHVAIVEEVIKLYDTAVWTLRGLVRDIEKVGFNGISYLPNID
jgi:hypothetical protein